MAHADDVNMEPTHPCDDSESNSIDIAANTNSTNIFDVCRSVCVQIQTPSCLIQTLFDILSVFAGINAMCMFYNALQLQLFELYSNTSEYVS